MGDRQALKEAVLEAAEREREILLELKRGNSDCKHVVRLVDFLDPFSGGPGEISQPIQSDLPELNDPSES